MLTILCYGITLLVYIIVFLWGVLGEHNGEYFGYGLFSFYYIIPITSFLGALIIGTINTPWKWFYPILFGVVGFVIPIIVFGRIANIPLLVYVLPSLVGLSIGAFVFFLKNR